MAIIFPPVESASPEGLVAIGGDLTPETLLTAYHHGIFPWPISHKSPLTWFSPDPRGILDINDLHISRSFKRFLNNHPYEVKFNTHFEDVIKKCALTPRKHESDTWITKEIINGYIELFRCGYAYCVEVYDQKELIGGLYGVIIGKYISGESMFHSKPNASKLALYSIIQKIIKNNGSWLDTQMVTPIIQNFGGKEMSRDKFLEKLKTSLLSTHDRKRYFAD